MNPTCAHCIPEPIARELAMKFGLDYYVTLRRGVHNRRDMDGAPFASNVSYIDLWHAFVRATARERKLIESRVGC